MTPAARRSRTQSGSHTALQKMSLDVDLYDPADPDGEPLFSSNITHNLNKMAMEAGIYECLWRPDEHGITTAKQVGEQLLPGIQRLASDEARYRKWDSPNGWGLYEHFLPWCMEYLVACWRHPDALVRVSR